jgi:hypothetical protein
LRERDKIAFTDEKRFGARFSFFIIDLTRIRVCTVCVCVSRVEKNRAPGGWNLTQLEREIS